MGEGQMPRVSDRDRVLRLLSETEGLSNNRIKTELDLPDERYATVRDMLLDDSLIDKYQCYGGGIRLTRKQTQGLQSGRLMGKLVFAAEESFQRTLPARPWPRRHIVQTRIGKNGLEGRRNSRRGDSGSPACGT